MSALAKTRADIQEESQLAKQEAKLRAEEAAMKLKAKVAEEYEARETQALTEVNKGHIVRGAKDATIGLHSDLSGEKLAKAKMQKLVTTGETVKTQKSGTNKVCTSASMLGATLAGMTIFVAMQH